MPTNERSLWVRLGLDTDQYGKGVKRAGKQTKRLERQTEGLGSTIKGFIGVAAVGAVTSFVSSVIRAQTETQRWADRLGIGVEALQELQFVGKQYGVTQDAITDGLKELSLRTDEFVKTGIGPAAEAFERLNLTQQELNKVSGDTEALFELVRKRISGVQNAAAKQRIADELFGGQGGEQFIEMLSQSDEKIAELRKTARDTGAVIDKETSENLELLATEWDNLGTSIQATTANIFGELIQLDKTVLSWRENLAEGVREFFGLAKEAGTVGKGVGEAIQKGIGGMAPGGTTGGTGQGLLAQQITGGGGGGGDQDRTFTPGQLTKSALGEVGSGFGLMLPQIRASREELQLLGTTMQSRVTPQMDGMIQKTNETGNVMSNNFMQGIELGQGFANVFSGMQNVIQSSLESSKGFLESFGKFLIDFLQGLIMKFIAAAAAAFLLAVAINAVTGGAGLAGQAGGVGNTFKQLLGGGQGGGSIISGFLADGGTTKRRGRYIVGEQGPELLNLPAGSNVRPLSGSGAGGDGEYDELVATVRGEDLDFVLRKVHQKKGNTY